MVPAVPAEFIHSFIHSCRLGTQTTIRHSIISKPLCLHALELREGFCTRSDPAIEIHRCKDVLCCKGPRCTHFEPILEPTSERCTCNKAGFPAGIPLCPENGQHSSHFQNVWGKKYQPTHSKILPAKQCKQRANLLAFCSVSFKYLNVSKTLQVN